MNRRFGKTDVIVLAVILVLLSAVGIFTYLFPKKPGAKVVISVEGEIYGEFSLEEDRVVEIVKDGNVSNILEIQDGKADMVSADCPDKLCVRQTAVSRDGATIVCLPNKVVVEVTGGEDTDFDSMVR